jgi:hypothetical protein
MTAKSSVAYDQFHHESAFNGCKTTVPGGVILEIIAPSSSIHFWVTASMVFDMYKLQSADSFSNSIRSAQAATNGQASLTLGPRLYLAETDTMVAQNFCTGKHLDGISMKISRKVKTIDSLLTGLCYIDVPLLCPCS